MKTWNRYLIVACGLLLAACANAPAPRAHGAVDPITQGQHIAETYCASCHAIGREGESPHEGAPTFRTLSQRYPIDDLEEAFAEGILVGHPDMPEFRLNPQQNAALVAYLQSIQTQPTPEAQP